ncbi:MAG: tyrosine--tRNA ligase [Candidatus Woesebacteria bacterium]|nr:tyrosine--tRNA ligase [Candidatus Woesebacteria bacterium]
MNSTVEEILTRRVTNIIPSKARLEELLNSGKKLNIYHGIDPTATRIHIGHAIPLRKLQEFVELGHNVTFLIGDFTALIGDTSDKDSERPVLTYTEIKRNFLTYKKQASKILDFTKVSVKFNSSWLKKLKFAEIIKLCQEFSFGDFAGRELIKKRLKDKKKVGLHEALYPVMQGYDSYFLDTDIQIGGADQTFNMMAGRVLQKNLKNKESYVLVTGYLTGTDGRKMSKSWGNAIWLTDTADEIYGKAMSLPDELIIHYFENATNTDSGKIKEITKALKSGVNPIDLKKELAYRLVLELRNKKDALKAKNSFEKSFQKHTPEYTLKIKLQKTLTETIAPFTNLKSVGDAKRLIQQGGLTINGDTVTDFSFRTKKDDTIKIGKKVFGKLI